MLHRSFQFLNYLMSLNKTSGRIFLAYIYRASILAQGSCGCPNPGSIQDQVRQGPEKPGPAGGVPVQDRGLELKDLYSPFQPKPFYVSVPLWVLTKHIPNICMLTYTPTLFKITLWKLNYILQSNKANKEINARFYGKWLLK